MDQQNAEKLIKKVSKSSDLSNCAALDELVGLIDDEREFLMQKLGIVQLIEDNLKRTVADRAGLLYGEEWKPITGHAYKLMRILQGPVFVISGYVDAAFTKQTVTVDAEKTTAYLKKHGFLPQGIEPNADRSSRIAIKPL
jgi:hypothetical protein